MSKRLLWTLVFFIIMVAGLSVMLTEFGNFIWFIILSIGFVGFVFNLARYNQ